MTVKTSKLLTD